MRKMVLKKAIILSMLCFFLSLSLVRAMIGVSPAIYDVDFKPGLKQVFHFEFFSDDGYPVEVSKGGDLAQYVELSNNYLSDGSGGINVLLNLPDKIDIPGQHVISIGGKQKRENVQGFALI